MFRNCLYYFSLIIFLFISLNIFADTGKTTKDLWADRVKVGGSVSLAGLAANQAPTTIGIQGHDGNTSNLILNYSDLNFTAILLEWMTAYTDIAYAQQAPAFIHDQPGNGNVLFLQEAYLKLGTSKTSPYYLKAGLINLPFGGLNYSSNMESFIQLLSLNGPPTLQVGVEQEQGINGSVYVFTKDKLVTDTDSTNVRDYGMAISYIHKSSEVGYRVGAGLISNLLSNFFIGNTTANNSNLHQGRYVHHVPGLNLQALFNYYRFDGGLRFIGALEPASVNDVPFTTDGGSHLIGAKLAGWSAVLGYTFDIFDYTSRLVGGYEGTSQAAAVGTASGAENFNSKSAVSVYNTNPKVNNYAVIGLPKSRIFAMYKLHVNKFAAVSLEIDDYLSYSTSNGGTGKNALMTMLQIGVQYG